MSQTDAILKHLKRDRTITGMEALAMYDCWRLPARILELREMGWNIITGMITTSKGKHIAKYTLNSKRRAA